MSATNFPAPDGRPSWLRDPYASATSLGTRFRHRRFRIVLKLIDAVLAEKGVCHIVDFGGTRRYWQGMAPLIGDRPIRLTLINLTDEADDGTLPFPVAALTADVCEQAPEAWRADFVHSNSLIEHLGGWTRMAAFADTIRASASTYYIQTPNFWFPFELHFHTLAFHWLPVQVRYRMLMRRRRGFFPKAETVAAAMQAIEEINLLDRPQLQALFPESLILREKLGFFTKSLMAVRHGSLEETRRLVGKA